MAQTDPIKKWLEQTRKSWLFLAQGAAWVLALVGGFLLPPPAGISGQEDQTWLRFAQFLVAALMGLIFYAVLKWRLKKHARGWWLTGFACLLLASGAFFAYRYFTSAWTGRYIDQRVVIGSVYTPQGRAYTAENPNLPLEILLEDFIGRAEDIWTRQSISRRRLALAGMYVSCLPLFTLCLIAVVQATRCLAGSEPRSKPR